MARNEVLAKTLIAKIVPGGLVIKASTLNATIALVNRIGAGAEVKERTMMLPRKRSVIFLHCVSGTTY